MKCKLISLVILLIGPASIADSTTPFAKAFCRLAMENIRSLYDLEEPEFWMEKVTTSIEEKKSLAFIDSTNPHQPKLNAKYEALKDKLLFTLYIESKSKSDDSITDHVISLIPPEPGQGILEYLSEIASEAAALFYENDYDKEVAFLNSVNSELHRLSLFNHDIMAVIIAELEVLHPKVYQDLKDPAETHFLYSLVKKIRLLDHEIEYVQSLPVKDPLRGRLSELKKIRTDTTLEFRHRRKTLFDKLGETVANELGAAIAIFGGDI